MKDQYFQIVGLEKTLESPLEGKDMTQRLNEHQLSHGHEQNSVCLKLSATVDEK